MISLGTIPGFRALQVVIDPLFPAGIVIALALALVVLISFSLVRRRPGAGWRALAMVALIVALLNPWLVREERMPLDDIALIAVDRSLSLTMSGRETLAEKTRQLLAKRMQTLPNIEIRQIDIPGDTETRLAPALNEAIRDAGEDRLAGVFVITDGQVKDETLSPETSAPIHMLLAGSSDEKDRRILLEDAPRYAIVGRSLDLVATVREEGPDPVAAVPLTLRINGETVARRDVTPGEPVGFKVPIDRPGKIVIEFSVPVKPDEIAHINNEAALVINGVRDRLKVLLITGEPYPGARVWRDILKSDAAVDLVHFTILRLPLQQDFTPVDELSLIAFPTYELFEEKLDNFNLIIFDRYSRSGVLPLAYLENVVAFVNEGGAVLTVEGPDFSTSQSLYFTPIGRILPAKPTGRLIMEGFRPTLTAIGQRHPITHALPGALSNPPGWGSWYRQVDAEIADGQTLLSGTNGRPLLIVKRQDEGRVAQLLSDQAWLWARGHQSGGPQEELLRRLAHWLMKEPELEEESLTAETTAQGFRIERRSLSAINQAITVERPDGTAETLSLTSQDQGTGVARMEASQPGIYRFRDGDLETVGVYGPLQSPELGALRSTDEIIAPTARETGGGIVWLGDDGVPEVREASGSERLAGNGWLGMKRRYASLSTGLEQRALLPPWAYLALIGGGLMMAWYREGRPRG